MDAITELNRRLDNLVRLGTVAEIDHGAARVRVQSGELLTNWLPWLTAQAGERKSWAPPAIDEQVLLISPSGELSAGVVIPAIYQDAFPAPSDDEHLTHLVLQDGAVIDYHSNEHKLRAVLPDGGKLEVTSPGEIKITTEGTLRIDAAGGIELNGDVSITGAVDITGANVTHNGKDIGATHKHLGVKRGGSVSGPPVP